MPPNGGKLHHISDNTNRQIMDYRKDILEKIAFIKAHYDSASYEVKMKEIIFNKCLSNAEITAFERKFSISLPDDYKYFLSEIGNGGFGCGYGLKPLEETVIDFKLEDKPIINLIQPFRYTKEWNEEWVYKIDWDNDEHPTLKQVDNYMDVHHIFGCLQIAHFGHGCTYLLVVSGSEKGHVWFDGRADYSGIFPELVNEQKQTFIQWYLNWLNVEIEYIKKSLTSQASC